MPKPVLCWTPAPGLEGLEPLALARAVGLELDQGGALEAAVVTVPEALAPDRLRARLLGRPVQWLDLAAELGGGGDGHRHKRAAAALSRAAGRASLGTLPAVYAPQPNQRVLVAGQGLSALAAARQAALLGHPVLLALRGDDPAAAGAGEDTSQVAELAAGLPEGIELAPPTELTNLTGAGGSFSAWLKGPQGALRQRFGAVVLAPGGAWEMEPAPAGLAPDLARPLSACDPASLATAQGWRQVAILAGVGQPATAQGFARALTTALALQDRPGVQVTLLFREALVATPEGERLYRQARQAGVLMARLADGEPRVADDGRTLAWQDQVLAEDLELAPDALFLAEEITAPWPGFLQNNLLWPPLARLLPEHARLDGGRTARAGFYVLGALRGTPAGDDRLAEAAGAVHDLHDLLGGGATPLPAVRHLTCARCLTCVRVCPHGVPEHLEDHIQPAPAACLACGICAAECPAHAIAPPGWSTAELVEGLARGLKAAPSPAMVLMACGQSAMPAFAQLSRQGHVWPAGLLALPLNCAGRVGLELILRVLSLGAEGVLVAGCHDGMCRSITGNLRARLAVGQAAQTLKDLGLRPEAVSFLHMANNQPQALAKAVEAMYARLGAPE
ncbi:MAG: hydrogenase iron-sulfur subunit [Desulfarculus sp.]|nr:hydrogenase iron-sulfur subunit [Desulfarculus sp.]